MRLLFDTESDGLLNQATRLHCITAIEVDTGREYAFNDGGSPLPKDGDIHSGLKLLESASELIGHNVIKHDAPLIRKIYPGFAPDAKVFDTLVATSVLFSDVADNDHARIKNGTLPHNFQQAGLIGSHSLEAWGWRVGVQKDKYNGTWEYFNEDMDRYARQDVRTTLKLYNVLRSKEYSTECLDLEHAVAEIIARQTRLGFAVDMEKITELARKLSVRRADLEAQLQSVFQPWKKSLGMWTPKTNNKKLGYVKGQPIEKFKDMVFNPGSRDHIADRLTTLRGWKPTVFTPSGKPQVDEKVLKELPYLEAGLLADYLECQKHLGMIAEGDNGWLKLARQDVSGTYRLHGEVRTNGAITGRMTHSTPNLAQVPKAKEFRGCFIASPGKVLVNADAEGLELRMLAHYVNNPEFTTSVVSGDKKKGTDAHTRNRDAVGYPQTPEGREAVKGLLYAVMYGALDPKLGVMYSMATTGHGPRNKAEARKMGAHARAGLMKGIRGLEDLVKRVKATVAKRGYLRGLDGRRLHVRSEHTALNTLLQGGGAILLKRALVLFNQTSQPEFVANVHDEWVWETEESHAKDEGEAACQAMCEAGKSFNLRCPISGSYGIGHSWAAGH